MSFREHGLQLFLDKKLYMAIIKLQADKSLGKSYAGLLGEITGLHTLGYLSDKDYEAYVKKYSCGLMMEDEQPLTIDQVREKNRLEGKDRQFKRTLEQWDLHSTDPQWKLRTFADAEKWKDKLESARAILALQKTEGK